MTSVFKVLNFWGEIIPGYHRTSLSHFQKIRGHMFYLRAVCNLDLYLNFKLCIRAKYVIDFCSIDLTQILKE